MRSSRAIPPTLPRIGPLLEVHERFPHRTNVQVARLTPDGAIEARVWERGAGETAASGSSAVAIAAAFGRSPVEIRFPGASYWRCGSKAGARF